MVVTLALESPEARDAVDGAAAAGGRVLLVPRTGAAASRPSARSPGSRARASCPTASVPSCSAVSPVPVSVRPVGTEPRRRLGRGRRRRRAEPTCRAAPRRWPASTRRSCAASREQLGSPRVADALQGVDDPGTLADTAGWSPDLSTERKIELLETIDPEARIELALEWARATLAELEVGEQIRSRVTEGMEKTQREFLLRQQLDAIRKELGEGGDDDATSSRSTAPSSRR